MLFVFSYLASLLLVLFSVPAIGRMAVQYQLFDDSRERRKIHQAQIPHFGGIAIYLGVLIPAAYTYAGALESRPLLLASLLVFTTGLVDDFKPVSPGRKFLFQFAAAFLLVVLGDVRILSLQQTFNAGSMPYLAGLALSIFFVVGLINAFNLIDGIDGLAACLSLFLFFAYAVLFFNAGWFALSLLCCSVTGALTGFLFFNLSGRHKIFMGDCGSLFIGLLAAFASIKLLSIGDGRLIVFSFQITAKIALVVSLLCIPMFDTLRVLVLRLASGRSPFQADDNHIHHRLLCLGLNHLQATGLLCVINLMLIILALLLQQLGNTVILLLTGGLMLLLNMLLTVLLRKSKVSRLQIH
jgi:UDP-N-acetylmuramyl pentapeptide phosphotransferase/UDP-N-acetylglucosamine-1-phosphate transferase